MYPDRRPTKSIAAHNVGATPCGRPDALTNGYDLLAVLFMQQ
jgi:hypothetical protein